MRKQITPQMVAVLDHLKATGPHTVREMEQSGIVIPGGMIQRMSNLGLIKVRGWKHYRCGRSRSYYTCRIWEVR